MQVKINVLKTELEIKSAKPPDHGSISCTGSISIQPPYIIAGSNQWANWLVPGSTY